MDKKLDQYLKIAMGAADLSNKILLNYFGKLTQVSEKNLAGLVSEADLACEKAIKEHVLGQGINFEFLGEEDSFAKNHTDLNTNNSSIGRWIIDPLDGTTNYVYKLSIYCTSIALEINGEVCVAVIDVPRLNDRYWAVRGQGAFKNGQPIAVSKRSKLKECLLATGFYAEDEEILEKQIKLFANMIRQSRAIRRLGSAAYDLCLVAEGIFDAFWETDLKPWDTAAGMLLVREAGGTVTNCNTDNYSPFDDFILSSNSNIYQKLKTELLKSP